MANHYFEGNPARMKTTSPFTDDGTGLAVDPSVVEVKWSYIGDTVTTTWIFGVDAQVIQDATGDYHADVPTDGKGGETCTYCWYGDPLGTPVPVCVAVDCNTFIVDPVPL